MNNTIKDADLEAWRQYKRSKSQFDRSALLKRVDPLIQAQANKWSGPIPRAVLVNELQLLAIKAFDTYEESHGTALSTHLVNSLQPISRQIYKFQNATRLPENLTLRLNSFLQAKEHLVTTNGHSPTLDELHQELGWSKSELGRIDKYHRRDLVESVGGLDDAFYDDSDDASDDVLAAIHFDLNPIEKQLFEHTTGYGNKPKLSNPEIMKRMNLSQAQLSYQKTLLARKVKDLVGRLHPHAR
jgi:DNA-directed RNA polymerase specialized sigma subunit